MSKVNYKSASMAFLSKTGVSNLNGGEVGGSVKKMPDGRIYVSGQMVKRSLMETIRKNNEDKFLSDSEKPISDIGKDMFSDLNGYLIPSIQQKRYSPLNVSPMIQVCQSYSGSDMLLRLSSISKPINAQDILNSQNALEKTKDILFNTIAQDESEFSKDSILSLANENKELAQMKLSEGFKKLNEPVQKALENYKKALVKDKKINGNVKDNRIASVEIVDAVYQGAIHLDNFAIGRDEVFNYENITKETSLPLREYKDYISEEERKRRAKEVLIGVANLTGFSKQARLSADASPDFMIICLSDVYSHKIQKAISYNDGKIDTNVLAENINDVKLLAKTVGAKEPKIFIGLSKNFIENYNEVKDCANTLNLFFGTPIQATAEAIKEL